MVFELRTLNRSLQQRALNLGEESSVENPHTHPQSLHSEIQQSQVHTHTHTHTLYNKSFQCIGFNRNAIQYQQTNKLTTHYHRL